MGSTSTAHTAMSWSRAATLRSLETTALYVKFRHHFLYFGHFELDVRGYTQAQGAAFSCLRLKLADMVLI